MNGVRGEQFASLSHVLILIFVNHSLLPVGVCYSNVNVQGKGEGQVKVKVDFRCARVSAYCISDQSSHSTVAVVVAVTAVLVWVNYNNNNYYQRPRVVLLGSWGPVWRRKTPPSRPVWGLGARGPGQGRGSSRSRARRAQGRPTSILTGHISRPPFFYIVILFTNDFTTLLRII